MYHTMKLTHQILAIAAVGFLFVCGCTRPDRRQQTETGPGGGTPVSGDWVIVHFDAEPENLNPTLSTTAPAARVEYGMNGSNIFETLLEYDPKDWSFTRPVLAESYPEISADHLTYTFTIRDGVK